MHRSSPFGLVLAATLLLSQACSSEPPAERPVEPGPQPVQAEPTPQPVKAEPNVEPQVEPQVEPEQPPEQLAVELPPLDNTCKLDSDCVPAPGCCPVPCTSNVINQNGMAEAQRRLKELCPEERQCMSAGGCRTHAYLCVKGTCALVYEGDKGYHERR
jgi:hypothetical protein